MMLKQTKIVASISDLRCEVDFIRDLFNAGMNVVRMNTAHASREGFEKLINNVRTVSNRIGILMDTKGPEVRTTASAEGPIDFKTGEKVRIVGNPEQETTHECISVTYPGFVHDLSVGADVLMDDGELELKVIDKNEDTLFCEVCNDATLGSRKSVNVPGVRINLPSLTEKTATISFMPSKRTSTSSLTLSCATVRMCWTSVRFWMHTTATSRLSPRLRTRKVWTTSTKSWKWPTV